MMLLGELWMGVTYSNGTCSVAIYNATTLLASSQLGVCSLPLAVVLAFDACVLNATQPGSPPSSSPPTVRRRASRGRWFAP